MPERRPLRVVHTSDVHLGAYTGSGDSRWAERRSLIDQAFTAVIDLAIREEAQALMRERKVEGWVASAAV